MIAYRKKSHEAEYFRVVVWKMRAKQFQATRTRGQRLIETQALKSGRNCAMRYVAIQEGFSRPLSYAFEVVTRYAATMSIALQLHQSIANPDSNLLESHSL